MLSQEEIINKEIKNEWYRNHKQILLKSVIIFLLFYIFTSPVVVYKLKKINIIKKKKVSLALFTSSLFTFIYYILHFIDI